MNKIKEYLRFLRRIRIIKYFYLNYFCKKIIRVDNSKIIPYKNAVIDIETGARIYIVNGDIEIGCNLLKGSREETRIRLRENAVWGSNGGCKISYGSTIEILKGALLDSKYFTVNSNSILIAAKKISLGQDVMIARNVVIYDSDFHEIYYEGIKGNRSKDVIIGEHVWVGTNSIILKGVNLKKGCVVAANTIVTENVESENLIGIKSEIKCINNHIQWKR